MQFSFNKGQSYAISEGVKWYHDSPEQILQIVGNPGTGKSVVISEIINRLALDISEVAPMAYTGAAATVMRMKGLVNAKTIHSWLYQPVEVPVLENGVPVMDTYFNRPLTRVEFVPKDLTGIKLILIDEAGMVPMNMRFEILRRGIKILCAGDLDQLDPIGDEPAFLRTDRIIVLDEIMRQAEHSAIIYLSQRAKHGLPIHSGFYGDVWVTTEDQVAPGAILASNVLLCGRNATRDRFIKHIRHDLLQIYPELPVYGEKVICRKNNWALESGGLNLTNGLSGRVMKAPDVSGFDGKTFKMNFLPDITNAPFDDLSCDYKYFTAPYNQREFIKKSPYSRGEKFEFGYALTVHLAQGSQYDNGIYVEEFLNRDVNRKLNYTAITRFARNCIYVKPKQRYY